MVFLHLTKNMDEPKHSPIKPDPGRYERTRAALAGAWIGLKERLSSPGPDLGAIWRPFEDLAWFLRKKVLWRLADRFSELGTRGRVATAGGVALAAGVGVAALALAVSGGSSSPTPSAPVAIVNPAPAPSSAPPAARVPPPEATTPKAPPAPTLHGAAPVFSPPKSKAKAGAGKPGGLAATPKQKTAKTERAIKPANAPAATAKIGATPTASATASSADAAPGAKAGAEGTVAGNSTAGGATQLDGPPAGPKAIKVARNFAGAFVVYETGGIDSKVRKTFGSSAAPALSHSLLKRPPRLPADVKVPRAKVVNIVPGPSQGKVFTVSVSLLRVGVTSELRLEMEQRKHDGWQVTNVLG
jgi:hypothetical protein